MMTSIEGLEDWERYDWAMYVFEAFQRTHAKGLWLRFPVNEIFLDENTWPIADCDEKYLATYVDEIRGERWDETVLTFTGYVCVTAVLHCIRPADPRLLVHDNVSD